MPTAAHSTCSGAPLESAARHAVLMQSRPGIADGPFLRLWHGFLTGRVMVALALLFLQGLGAALNQIHEPVLMALCVGYLVATAALRVWAHHTPPPPHAGAHWLPSVGVDLAMFTAMQTLHVGAMNFAPLFGLPILMAGVMGTLTLALGTTAAATLLTLAGVWWIGDRSGGDLTQRYLQAGLTGTGYFVVAYLVHQLATRLISVQQAAQQSQMAARAQEAVSARIIENLADGVLVLDRDNVVRMANPAALLLLGHETPLAVPFALAATEDWAPLRTLARRTFGHEQPQSADVDILQAGQRPLGLRVRTWLTSNPGDAPSSSGGQPLCVMFLHDLREMEARLRTEKLAAMGRMSAAVAHEIRNPLAAIMQASALLEEDLSEPTHRRLAQMVQQNGDRLARIAEEVLDIARVQHQISHAPAAVLALDDAVAQVWNDWRAQDPARRVAQLSLQAADMQVEFDADHLRRVLVNLLDNALRYMGPHADSLFLETSMTSSGHLSLQVWSDGAPLDKSVERHLFEPFFSSESRSSGLGLYICRELCQRHGASIGYQRSSRELAGRGTVSGNAFIVSFRKAVRPTSGKTALFDTIVV